MLIYTLAYLGMIYMVLDVWDERGRGWDVIWSRVFDDLFDVVARVAVLVAIRAVLVAVVVTRRGGADVTPEA